MSDFHARLIEVAEKLGAEDVRLERMGSVGTGGGRFRSHPHIAGVIAGQAFRLPVPSRPKDTSRRRHNYVAILRRHLLSLAGKRAPDAAPPVPQHVAGRVRRQPRPAPGRCAWRPRGAAPAAGCTRLARDPWAPLIPLLARMTAEGKDMGGAP